MLKGRHNAGGRQRVPRRGNASKRIKFDRIIRVGDVEITQVMHAGAWNGVDNGLGQVAVRVYHGQTVALVHVQPLGTGLLLFRLETPGAVKAASPITVKTTRPSCLACF
jgi:hypothetical protein